MELIPLMFNVVAALLVMFMKSAAVGAGLLVGGFSMVKLGEKLVK